MLDRFGEGTTVANKEHIKRLKQGVPQWNAWREQFPGTGADLRGARLGGANLSRANLSGANLLNASLNTSNLMGAKLNRANLVGARLGRATCTAQT